MQKSNIISICCLALATTIALCNFYAYKPSILYKPEASSASEDHYELETYDDDDEDDDVAVDDYDQTSSQAYESGEGNQLSRVQLPNGMQECQLTMKSGDSLAGVLNNLGIDVKDVYAVSSAVAQVFKLKHLKPGVRLIITLTNDSRNVHRLEFSPDFDSRLIVERSSSGFKAEKIAVPLKKITKNISGNLNPRSPYTSLRNYGMNNALANDMIRAINHITNLKSAKTPVSFELLYEDFYRDDGEPHMGKPVAKPKMLYVSVVIDGKVKRIYKFCEKNGAEYIDSSGMVISSIQNRAMFIQPMVYRKITSRFGLRIHPTSGRIKRHTGVDLAAAHGTPVKAAASGTVSKASYYSGYGKYIKINHSHALSTAYGHLSRIVVQPGQYVRQGQVIGYCGNTGRATGSHLHYEVMKNGQFMNPLAYVPCQPEKLSGKRLANFNAFKKAVNLHIEHLSGSKKHKS